MPVFHLTGTADRSPLEDFEPRARQIPFDSNASVDQYLMVMENAVHMTFAGITSMGGRDVSYPGIERHHELIKIAALAFWDDYLKGDADALAWLQGGGYAHEVGDAGTFRYKPAACAPARAAAR